MYRIERAQVENVAAIKQVLSETWVATYGPFLSPETIERVTLVWHDPKRLAIQIEDPQYFFGVAKSPEDTVVGLVCARLIDDEVLMINRLYVHPNTQRQGIGEALLQASITAFPNVRRARLEVERRNHIGYAFWRKQGFKDGPLKKEHVGQEVLEVVEMEKPL
jgi:ribosomal protein S18 acetylase RimI-like enzyme